VTAWALRTPLLPILCHVGLPTGRGAGCLLVDALAEKLSLASPQSARARLLRTSGGRGRRLAGRPPLQAGPYPTQPKRGWGISRPHLQPVPSGGGGNTVRSGAQYAPPARRLLTALLVCALAKCGQARQARAPRRDSCGPGAARNRTRCSCAVASLTAAARATWTPTTWRRWPSWSRTTSPVRAPPAPMPPTLTPS
jgi:hypothetical protein